MKIYVCWDTKAEHPLLGKHPCGLAYHGLRDAGWDPEVIKARGWTKLPDFLNPPARRAVKQLTGGNDEVPVLVTDDGEVIQGMREIRDWAKANPAPSPAA